MEPTEEKRLTDAEQPAAETQEETEKVSVQEAREKTRRNVLHLAAGAYLLYLAFKLGSGFAAGIGTQGWNVDMIISLAGMIVFALTGGFLLVSCAVRFFREHKNSGDSFGGTK